VFETLPLGSPGVIDVDMGVDEAGKNDQWTDVHFRDADCAIAVRPDASDESVRDPDRGRPHSIGQDDAFATD
jgi:hypothetical protein